MAKAVRLVKLVKLVRLLVLLFADVANRYDIYLMMGKFGAIPNCFIVS